MIEKVDNPPRIKLFLVDDQAMLRAAFRSLLAQNPRFEVVGDCGDARVAIERIKTVRPDVLLLDISMPGLSGLDAIEPLREAHPRMRIVMLTHHEGESFVDQAMSAGADGYLSKDSDPSELALGIEAVFQGRPYLSPKVATGLVSKLRRGEPIEPGSNSRISSLTQREREVFQLLALGKSNKDIARELVISVGTAKKHRENLQRKLECHSTAELALLAIREGLLQS
ncbi:MAG TPA: response regulator transcription factor [Planctomycetota bacterium]|nr:response regulator transcription factor [Planctomycetota bacterium]